MYIFCHPARQNGMHPSAGCIYDFFLLRRDFWLLCKKFRPHPCRKNVHRSSIQENHKQHTAGCVAVKNGAEKLYGSGTPTTEAGVTTAILYNNFSETNQTDIDLLNAAIKHYNDNNPPVEAKCDYHWGIDNVNNSPVLFVGAPM